ncbi:MAG: hypothetical protein HY078_01525 [Elusimicrobia bacterium]|nr:hypothetical protein [Elusimicrobiota bacterium]
MSKDTLAQTLIKLRAQAGYPSARAFFKDRGGQRHFGCTYRQYVNIERGRSTPGPRLLEKIAVGLRLLEDKENARDFFKAYLLAISKSADLVDLIVAAFTPTPDSMHKAQPEMVSSLVRSFETKTKVLSREASEYIAASPDHFWPFTILENDSGHWEPQALADAAGLQAAKVKRTLERLVEFKLVQRDREGKYFIQDPDRVVFRHPSDRIFSATGPLTQMWEGMAAQDENPVLRSAFFARAAESEVRQYAPFLLKALWGASVVATTKKAPDTAFFLMQVSIRKVLPF